MLIRILVFCVCIISILDSSSAGNISKLDSLKIELTKSHHDSILCRLYLDVGDIYFKVNSDSALKYNTKGLLLAQSKRLRKLESKALTRLGQTYRIQGQYPLAIENFLSAIRVDEGLGDMLSVSMVLNNLGLIHLDQGNYERSIDFFNKSLEIKKEFNDTKGLAATYTNIGIVNRNQGHYEKAIEKYLESLRLLEGLNDKEGIAKCYLNIGNIYYNQRSYLKALEFYQKSMGISEELNDSRLLSLVYNNIGIIHRSQNESDKAIEYYRKSLEIFEEMGDMQRIAVSYNNIGIVYRSQKDFDNAVEYLKKSLEIREQIGDKRGLAGGYSSLAETFNNIASSTQGKEREKYLNQSLTYGKKAYEIAHEIGALLMQSNAAENLKITYTLLRRNHEALKYANILLSVRDSLFSHEKAKVLAEMQTRFETEKKQQEIESQQLIIETQKIENHKQLIQRNFLLAGSVLLSVMFFIILWAYQQKKRSNIQIIEKNALLSQANEEILATTETLSQQNQELIRVNNKILKQQAEIEDQRNQLANLAWEIQETNLKVESQRSMLSDKNREITDSIIYAQRIQSAVFPSIDLLKPYFTSYFILHKPKSIVSGDFYWATQVKDWLVFCVADCTGHGVPGALMSMLGVAFLNEIVRKEEINNSAMVLNELREYIINSLFKPEEGQVNYEGMDIGLCVYNVKSSILQFSGANISCWLVPNELPPQKSIQSIIELAYNKMPIGYHEIMESFDFCERKLAKGDRLYICTDGYADQIGGSDNRKIQSSKLKELILNTLHLSIDTQNEYLHNYFLDWQGNKKQLDDVTILCILV